MQTNFCCRQLANGDSLSLKVSVPQPIFAGRTGKVFGDFHFGSVFDARALPGIGGRVAIHAAMQILPQSRSAIESCAARKLEISLKFGIALVTKARMKNNKRVSTIRVWIDFISRILVDDIVRCNGTAGHVRAF